MQNQSFPGWAAPIVGAVLGVLLGFRGAKRDGAAFSPEWAIGGAAVGLFAGLVVWLLDAIKSRSKRKRQDDAAPDDYR